ncbi:hypothetical protein PI124_g13638 [Phytophthora idaei]|nr:hypothetical protein PI125_g20073 [Phytophthora idaei]KAG3241494.1 hypothetical protein PI124_g13638 [Phytophthora idaei]
MNNFVIAIVERLQIGEKLNSTMHVIRDIGFCNGLKSIVRLLDPIIAALRELETDTVFVSGVYRWFRWLRFHAAYGVTSPEQEEQETVLVGSDDAQAAQQTTQQYQAGIEQLSDTVDLISASVFADHALENTAAEGENLQDGDNYENVESLQVDELQTFSGKGKKTLGLRSRKCHGNRFHVVPNNGPG